MSEHIGDVRFGIVGAGAIGGFLAAKIASVGGAVAVLARGATLEAIGRDGLSVESSTGDVSVGVEASDDAATLGPVDLCIFAVKGQDSVAAAEAMRPMIGGDTTILSFQNGMGGLEALEAIFGRERLAAGVTYLPATVVRPGLVRHTGAVRRFVFGPAAGATRGLEALREAGEAAGLEMELLEDPMPAIWEKLVMLSAFHGISALTRLPLGEWVNEDATARLYLDGMREAAAVGAALGVALPEDLSERHLKFAQSVADPATRGSMLTDVEAGRPLELEASIGWLRRKGREVGVATPVHDVLWAALKPLEGGASR